MGRFGNLGMPGKGSAEISSESAHEISMFLSTVTEVNGVQIRATSQSPSKVLIKAWKWVTDEAALPVNSLP